MPKRLQSMVCLFWMTLVLVSCGIRPSINDRPSLEAYNSEAPVVIEVNDSTRLSGTIFW